ncbi:hypothetical protein LTR53_014844, partial [Teratosphaeriaceae sp. CCFEE 6253]
SRLARFKRIFNSILELCNRPRDPVNEGPLLEQLGKTINRLALLVREETRASIPHLCLQYAASSQIYTVIARAAIVSQYEPIIQSSVALFAALVDSEEEDFLSSASFAKSLMRLVTKVADSGSVIVSVDNETSILELLFSIAAKIRLQPEILPVWFRSTVRPELEDVFVREKKSFVGITQRDDFPLCYLLIDRVHHEGRMGDFARTGLLYIFEATGRSIDLEEWVISSDLPTLMASGLGALYSQLSRELSILHPDATLPAVLAMSDYSTTHPKATAESAFSKRHQAHMGTFLSYLAFWQDVLDHCRSADVKQTLLDHYQILFLQQLLYPSLLQSSDTDAGSSVAVLTYMSTILEALEYPDLLKTMLTYLLAIPEGGPAVPSTPATPAKRSRPSMPPRSPTTVRRRQSLMLLTAPKNPDDALEPALFSLTDVIFNSLQSRGAQTTFAGLRLISTMFLQQRKYGFGTLLKVRRAGASHMPRKRSTLSQGDGLAVDTVPSSSGTDPDRGLSKSVGALELEVEKYSALATTLHGGTFPEDAYVSHCDDMRYCVEAQVPIGLQSQGDEDQVGVGAYTLTLEDPLMRSLRSLLRTFLSNSVDVNLGLTQAIISIATCVELRLDGWFALDPARYAFVDLDAARPRPWQAYLEPEESTAWTALQQATRHPVWSDDSAPLIFATLTSLAQELDLVHSEVPSLAQLLLSRQQMLQAASSQDDLPAIAKPPSLDAPRPTSRAGHSRSSSTTTSSSSANRRQATNPRRPSAPLPRNRAQAASSTTSLVRPVDHPSSASPALARRSWHQPQPPEIASESPLTTDFLMQKIVLPADGEGVPERSASLNHVLTNIVVLQQFTLELVAVLQVRASVLGDGEVAFT